MRNSFRILAVMLFALIVASAAFANGDSESMDKSVSLVYVNWEEGVAWTHFLATVLEDEMGYDVTLTAADVGPAYASVIAGDQDYFMEAWLPNLHEPYVEGKDIETVSTIYEDAVVGLIVPQYMADDGVTALSDLRDEDVAEKLDYKITGIDAGAGMMIKTEDELIPDYGLDDIGYELVPSSSPAMLAAMQSAINNKEYIVGMGWQPHSMFGRMDLAILKQDEDQIWDKDNVYIMGRPGVEDDLPVVSEFFDNVLWTNETIGPLMVYLSDSDKDTLEAAREWKNDHPEVWQDWVPEM
jgi:glycine betaine/proline transport system substrate-binding protein